MNAGPGIVYHFGPSREDPGGIASVIARFVELQLGADSVHAVPTWRPGSYARSGALALRAAALVARLPATTGVHIHMSYGGSFVREAAVLAVARARGLPRVVTIHSARFADFSTHRPRLVTRVLGMATMITVLTEANRDIVGALVPRIRVELVPNPTPLDHSAGPVAQTGELVLFAGTVSSDKGVDVLQRAWHLVSASRPAARCLVVGRQVGLELAPLERFEVRGPVSRAEVRELIRGARVVVLPSLREGLPMILSEAMAAARPFVSTPVGGVPSLAAGGVLVPVGDHDALAAAIVELLAHPSHAQALGEAGQALCRRWMAPNAIDAQLRALYTEAAARSGRAV